MGSNTVSLKDETYRKLRREKRDDESFIRFTVSHFRRNRSGSRLRRYIVTAIRISDVIDRLLVQDDSNPLRELIGLVDEDEFQRPNATVTPY